MVANLTTQLGQLTSSPAGGPYTGRNRIINGDMLIDQRNAGASVTNINGAVYTLDRYYAQGSVASKYTVQQNAGSVTPPAGFTNYLGVTSLSSYSVGATDFNLIAQPVEGFNCADLSWGTANAKAITISFWVRSSLTGTFGGAIRNSGANRSYPYLYTISSANTWTQISITVPGDTSGTWLTTNGTGLLLYFGLGVGANYSGTAGAWNANNNVSATGGVSVVGTNAATFYFTGVKLEVGSIATPFVPDDRQVSLAKCQRYYCKTFPQGTAPAQNTTIALGTLGDVSSVTGLSHWANWRYPTVMRAAPSITTYSTDNASNNWYEPSGALFYSSNVVNIGDAAALFYSGSCVAAKIGQIHATADAEL